LPVIAEIARGSAWSDPRATTFEVSDDPIALPTGVVLSRRRETVGSIVHLATDDLAAVGNGAGVERAFLVESTVQLDGPSTTGPIMFVFFARRRDMTVEAFRAHWRNRHAPLARRHHVGMSRYVQHVVVEGTDPNVDGIAELHFASTSDLTDRFYESDASIRAIAEDVAKFSGRRADTYLVTAGRAVERRV
jgi:uncharacterized protein (TIGR02118 family)